MTLQASRPGRPAVPEHWFATPAEDVAAAVDVDPAVGLTAPTAAERLQRHGPDALPEETAEPGWLRFLEQYRSYMQIILLAAAVVSAVIGEWGTAVLLVALTVLNAVVGLRQEGEAESAMNALKSMMKATARVRRDGSRAAVADAQRAHIRVRMVTGDDVITGAAIATRLGIPGEAVLGTDFAALSEAERLARIDDIGVVGRVAPEHKVLLVDTLEKKGEVVAMTGDGVNDAPAIKAADIGIAMGSGTDVAKNVGRMILSDDEFATIVFAVEQGRKIFDNLTKYIRFVLILLVVFVLTFLGASLLDIAGGEPFDPAQVLWTHFFVNAVFGVALGFDEESPGLMSLRPRPRGQSVLTRSMFLIVGLVGLAIAVGLLALIRFGTVRYGDVEVGVSIAFTAFALCLIVAALECRSETGTIFTTATFGSRQMNRAVFVELVLAVLVTQSDLFNRLLGTTDLTLAQSGWALVPAFALLLLWEAGKLIARRVAAGRADADR